MRSGNPAIEVPAPGSSTEVRGRPITFGFVPALDGLRAISVIGVMMYHGGAPILSGGFLTIDVFFVLSGFLITSLLLGEWTKRMTIRLGQFWTRRARRLLPALLVMLVGVAIYAKVFATPGEFAELRLDSLSTLFYVANWHFIFEGGNYFVQTAQTSPLAHMWSLSIEEQFYIVWPPVALLLLRWGRRLRPSRHLWPILAAAVIGAIASAIDMRLSYLHGASIMRIYEGTDTRCQDILIGAALAIGMAIWAQHRAPLTTPATAESSRFARAHPSAGTAGAIPPHAHRRDRHRRRGPRLKLITAWEIASPAGRLGLQILGWSALAAGVLLWTQLTGPSAFLFEGGYFLFALGVAAVIFCSVTAQTASLARSLGNPVFRYVGKISYGTYLWHFPLFDLLNGARMHLYGYPLLAVRIAVTLVVATGSFYLVEEPIRRGRMRSLTEWRAWLMTSGAFLGVVVITVVATLPTTAGAAGTVRVTGAQYTGPPVKVAIFGDSVAWRLGFAMLASQPQNAYDVNIDNGAIVGCGLVLSTAYQAHGVADPTAPACDSSSPKSVQWPAQWRGDLEQFHPNVVVVLAGRWEVEDRLIGGRWLHIGDPVFDADLKASLEQAVSVGTSTGALMVLMTSPCFDSGEQDNGLPWPEDSPSRLADYNQMVREVAAEHPGTVQVDDFGALLCPGGVFTTSFDGIQIRDGDGVHIVPTPAAGQWLDAHLLPDVVKVGRLQMAGDLLTTPASTTSSPSPPSSGGAPGTTATATAPGSPGGFRAP
jgi:peptidoglycan/LPS O-acetylase OafA/YrhL